MTDDDDDDDDKDPRQARATDPWTSHNAIPGKIKMSAQRHQVLGAFYKTRRELIDHDAYRLAGLTTELNGARQRCSDLRRAGWIKWTGGHGAAPSGRPALKSAITADGIKAYELWELFHQ